MAITSYPFDNQDTTETQFSWLFRELQDSGVCDSSGGTGLLVTADASGMTVKIASGRAIVRGHVMNNDAVYTQAIAPANTQPRIDLVVLRLDPTANTIVPAVLQGAASATPISPTPTQTDAGTYELVIARIAVAANAPNVGPSDVTDLRPFVGTRVGAWSTNTRPLTPRKYQLGFNSTTGLWEYYTGSTWTRLVPAAPAVPGMWPDGTSFPASPLVGDTIKRTDLSNNVYRWDGAAWYPTGPISGKIWRTLGASAALAQNTQTVVQMGGVRFTGGMTWDGYGALTVPVDGLYHITASVYWTGSGSWYATGFVNRGRAGVADAFVGASDLHLHAGTIDARSNVIAPLIPLKAGDRLWLTAYNYTGGSADAKISGGAESASCYLSANYVAALNGITPL